MTTIPIKRALLSVSDKSGLIDFAKNLTAHGIEIVSTGGTAKILAEAGLEVINVAEVTGAAEMMDGRVKTLHPKIHGGILARRDDTAHASAMEQNSITPIDLVVVNLYPFGEVLRRQDSDADELIETIDIGGPALIRGSAKNHDFVTVITDANDYDSVFKEIAKGGGTNLKTRQRLAAKAFAHTAHYDATIANWMQGEHDPLTEELTLGGKRLMTMRYGENPHQQAGLYESASRVMRHGVLTAEQIQGKPLSFNNVNDTDAAFELVCEFESPTIAIIKHANPCGVACHDDLTQAWGAALACDSVSAFGGIVAVNKTLSGNLARQITDIFTEVVIAPDADEDAKAIMAEKPNLRLLLTHGVANPDEQNLVIRSVAGGFLAQTRDAGRPEPSDYKCVTKRKPSEDELNDLIFAMSVAKHVKSNAIVYAKDNATVGIGAGQMSRLDSSRIAGQKAEALAKSKGFEDAAGMGCVVASDAFFPFADGLLAAAEAGATAVIQPGGSVNDKDVITAADEANLAMIFTGQRNFRH